MRGDLDLFLLIEEGFLAGIDYDKIRSGTLHAGIFSGTQQNFVLPFRPIELPRGLEQLEELANKNIFSWICHDAYHD